MRKAIDHPPLPAGSAAAGGDAAPGALQQVLVACAAAALALAARWAEDPWLGDRHEFVPVYVSIAAATWLASWRAGALTTVLFFVGSEALFGAARSAADASTVHAAMAAVSYWAVCGLVLLAVHLARQQRTRLEDRVRQLGEADHRKSDFIALLAHELRNPLSVVCTRTELIRQGRLDARAVEEAWQALERQTVNMKRLIGDLLDTARAEQGKLALQREHVDVAALVRQVVADTGALLAARRQRIELSVAGQPEYAYVDAQRIGQVIDNLLNNASKFSPEGAAILVSLQASLTDLTIAVRDSGMGIPPAALEVIFDSFVQVDPSGARSQGLGLGLALCRTLVEMHGGSIEARSAGTGRGAEFVVRLPRPPELAALEQRPAAQPRTAAGAAAAPAAPSAQGAARRVLVVDDDADGAESLAEVLRLEGYEATTAHDGRSALEAAGTQHPDVVFLDMHLPDMPGPEVAARLGRSADAPTVIGLSGEEAPHGLPPGFAAYIVKPFQIEEMLAALAALAPAETEHS